MQPKKIVPEFLCEDKRIDLQELLEMPNQMKLVLEAFRKRRRVVIMQWRELGGDLMRIIC